MKLSFDQLRSIARGVARVEENDGLVAFYRFTEAQSKLYEQRDPGFYRKSKATSGVILEFDTDSTTLSLDVFVTGGSSRRFCAHSIFVNGQRIGQLGDTVPGDMESIDMRGSFCLGLGMKRVKIIFPWAAASSIRCMALDDGAALIPVQKEKTIVFFGDSITQGYDAALPEDTYAAQLTRWLDWNAVSKAIGGEIFCPELATLPEEHTPDLISVAYGTNDWSVCTHEKLQENCRGFYRNLRKTYPQTPIVVMSPIWRADTDREDCACPFRQVAQLLQSIAQEIGNAIFIDCFDFMPHDTALFSDTYLHPNEEGFRHYAAALIRSYEALQPHK